MQQIVERTSWHKLSNCNEIFGRIACTNQRQNIWMGKNSQFWEFLIKIASYTWCDLTNSQNFGYNVIFLPSTSPCFTRRTDRNFCVKLQVFDVNAFESWQCGISGSSFRSHPVLVFEANLFEFLTAFDSQIMKPFGKQGFCFIQRSVSIFVGQGN